MVSYIARLEEVMKNMKVSKIAREGNGILWWRVSGSLFGKVLQTFLYNDETFLKAGFFISVFRLIPICGRREVAFYSTYTWDLRSRRKWLSDSNFFSDLQDISTWRVTRLAYYFFFLGAFTSNAFSPRTETFNKFWLKAFRNTSKSTLIPIKIYIKMIHEHYTALHMLIRSPCTDRIYYDRIPL